MRQNIITECAEYLLNTMDFCGDIQEALKELKAEHNLTGEEVEEIRKKANITWKKSQVSAGVKRKYRTLNKF